MQFQKLYYNQHFLNLAAIMKVAKSKGVYFNNILNNYWSLYHVYI